MTALQSNVRSNNAIGPQHARCSTICVPQFAAPGRLALGMVVQSAWAVHRQLQLIAEARKRVLRSQHISARGNCEVVPRWVKHTTRPTMPYKGNVSSTLAKMAMMICAQN